MRRAPPPTPRLPPFRLHYPTHAGNMLSSIPPPYEMAFPPPRPKKKKNWLAFTAVLLASASAVFFTGFYGVRQWSNAKARDKQVATMRNERVAETQALLGKVHDNFPLDIADEHACGDAQIPEGARTPLLSFSRLRADGTPSPAETALAPTTFEVTRDTALDGPVVAVLMTSSATIVPGSYDGWIVVFDRKATPLCQARVVAKSGESSSFADFKNQLRGAERAAAVRLSPKLALEL